MMKIRVRGSIITFSHTFLDSAGAVVNTATATLKVAYPDEHWPLDGSDYETEEVELTEDEDNVWSGTWDSRVSQPGVIYWTIYTDDTGQAVADGHFRLRGNPANLEVEA